MTPQKLQELRELLERLRTQRTRYDLDEAGAFVVADEVYRNPDGPDAAAVIETLNARCERAVKALEPFAREAEWMTAGYPDDARPDQTMSLTFADYRAARAALSTPGAKP